MSTGAAEAALAAAAPEGESLADRLTGRIARYETRTLDWDALKFQADFDPKYRRAQMRYVGTGGTGVAKDSNTVPAEHFTFSTMVLPAGCEGPMHVHRDVEEVFFIVRGHRIRMTFEAGGERFETVLGERDLVSVPPRGVPRPRQRRDGGSADVRDAGYRPAGAADLPARPSAREGPAALARARAGRRVPWDSSTIGWSSSPARGAVSGGRSPRRAARRGRPSSWPRSTRTRGPRPRRR